jgi:hypothetical protein
MAYHVSTGHHGLDRVIDELRIGDNVVWQVDQLDDYRLMANLFLSQSNGDGKTVHYIRFGQHDPILKDGNGKGLTLHVIDTQQGFETFTQSIYTLVTHLGPGAFYIFDSLSDLLEQWGSDLMIENFFRIICPYLFELDTIAYFAVMRGAHSFEAIAGIRETTQLLLDIYHLDDALYVHPLKVWQRYASTMYLPHKLIGDVCMPLTNSVDASRFFSSLVPSFAQSSRHVDYWDRLFQEAQGCLDNPETPLSQQLLGRLRRMLLSDEGQIGQLASRYFDLPDLIGIKNREIGTGKIGGKAVGMLLARKILKVEGLSSGIDPDQVLEPHDSYYLGADLFYSYIVQNGWWKLRTEQKTPEGYFEKAEPLRRHLLEGSFSSSTREKFQQLLETFGQAPIIVRSSSLLEDDFGNAFAGKYESIFCANQGSPQQRLDAFEHAVRQVYASTMDSAALSYRLKRGLQDKDEQMALLVQRVSGEHRGKYFYPLMAGVGHSKNLYVWNDQLDAQAGMLRLVFGLGTRAVDRVEGDYPRIVALDQPLLSSHDTKEAEKTYSQHYVDLLDLEQNALITIPLEELIQEDKTLDLSQVGEIDWEETQRLAELGYRNNPKWVLNFNKVLSDAPFIGTIHDMIRTLEMIYAYPIDIEFTINQHDSQHRVINLLQCRPLQTRSVGATVSIPEYIDKRNVLIESKGHFMGGNVNMNINYIVYVIPEKYALLTDQERYQVARIIGQLNQTLFDAENAPTLLLGPGRWGTSTPSLGVPVNFSEIDNIAALAEVSFETAGMMPELSFGSHFFQDLVEANVFYLAVLPHLPTNYFNLDLILKRQNIFIKILPQHYRWADIIRVYDFSKESMTLFSDITTQKLLCLCQNCRKDIR